MIVLCDLGKRAEGGADPVWGSNRTLYYRNQFVFLESPRGSTRNSVTVTLNWMQLPSAPQGPGRQR